MAWLDVVPKTIMPVMASITDLFDKDDVYAFLPIFKIWKVETFSVDGDKDKFYPIVFRADGWDEGLLEIKMRVVMRMFTTTPQKKNTIFGGHITNAQMVMLKRPL
ncbi:hypothetical protein THIOM_002964 [Candidatus Thiomargarita nelsonii]|uniref:Uncharacterized protein n=1 Tax=Candidatus Thiomargarita nelsonii TaxID=1003181 RepID=A0A176RZY5_9GAMM|nr:hypothetical protein THIOM_002964 [Candidatus Thiomargarita nelsonii]